MPNSISTTRRSKILLGSIILGAGIGAACGHLAQGLWYGFMLGLIVRGLDALHTRYLPRLWRWLRRA